MPRQNKTIGVKLLWWVLPTYLEIRAIWTGQSTESRLQCPYLRCLTGEKCAWCNNRSCGRELCVSGEPRGLYESAQHPYETGAGHLAKFLHAAKDYARKNGFKGVFFIEPKPMDTNQAPVWLWRPQRLSGFCGISDSTRTLNWILKWIMQRWQAIASSMICSICWCRNALAVLMLIAGDPFNGWGHRSILPSIVWTYRGDACHSWSGGFQGGGIISMPTFARNSPIRKIFSLLTLQPWILCARIGPLHTILWKSLPTW